MVLQRFTKSQGCKHTHTHTPGDFKDPGRCSTSSSTGSQTGWRGEQEEKSLLVICMWMLYSSKGQKGRRFGNASLWHSFKHWPYCNLPGPLVTLYCFSFHVSQMIKTCLSNPEPRVVCHSLFAWRQNAQKSPFMWTLNPNVQRNKMYKIRISHFHHVYLSATANTRSTCPRVM